MDKGFVKVGLIAGVVSMVVGLVGWLMYRQTKLADLEMDFSSKKCKECGMYFCHGECLEEEE